MFERILLPTDGSTQAKQALARTEERRLDAIDGSVVLANVSTTTAGDADWALSWLDLLARTGVV